MRKVRENVKLIQLMPFLMLLESATAMVISAFQRDRFGVIYWGGCVIVYYSLVMK